MMKLNKSDLIDEFLTPALKNNIQLEEDQNKLLSCSYCGSEDIRKD